MTARLTGLVGHPVRDCLLVKPDRQIASAAQPFVVFRPVANVVLLLLRVLVLAALGILHGRTYLGHHKRRILLSARAVQQRLSDIAKRSLRRLGGWCEISPCGPKWRFATTRSIICRQVTGNLSSSWPKGRSNGFTKELSRGTDCALPSTMHGSAVVCTSDETPIVGFWTNTVTVEPRRAVRPRRLFLSQRAYSVVPRIFETGYAASRGRL